MNDLPDLPLFSGRPADQPPPKSKRRRPRERNLVAELTQAHIVPEPIPEGTAVLLPFPASRDRRLITELADAFMSLRERHGRRCRAMLLDKRFRPIGVRLRRMGMSPDAIQDELARLEKAVARVVWIADGRPSYSSGGGSAA
ncbi:DUF6074 family protein [Methylobacterium sp. J-070]|uniref:DUF6074 family protein n=1 Tax=Methylobacterium sp. J-070 TaxID=2836650 RepID=UPI001FBA2376|nr:DUF6074 family protein [Methylobacterium sp. J-070]MCJ2051260.1 DUF6074 family protein [Methylobacterium sp. J-070]